MRETVNGVSRRLSSACANARRVARDGVSLRLRDGAPVEPALPRPRARARVDARGQRSPAGDPGPGSSRDARGAAGRGVPRHQPRGAGDPRRPARSGSGGAARGGGDATAAAQRRPGRRAVRDLGAHADPGGQLDHLCGRLRARAVRGHDHRPARRSARRARRGPDPRAGRRRRPDAARVPAPGRAARRNHLGVGRLPAVGDRSEPRGLRRGTAGAAARRVGHGGGGRGPLALLVRRSPRRALALRRLRRDGSLPRARRRAAAGLDPRARGRDDGGRRGGALRSAGPSAADTRGGRFHRGPGPSADRRPSARGRDRRAPGRAPWRSTRTATLW